jgi:hypothetical protein
MLEEIQPPKHALAHLPLASYQRSVSPVGMGPVALTPPDGSVEGLS